MKNTICEVNVCERISPDGGVCYKCADATMNSGVNNQCGNEQCGVFLCDHCGEREIAGYMGGEGSAFLCCNVCWEEVSKLHPSDLDYQTKQKHSLCPKCQELTNIATSIEKALGKLKKVLQAIDTRTTHEV